MSRALAHSAHPSGMMEGEKHLTWCGELVGADHVAAPGGIRCTACRRLMRLAGVSPGPAPMGDPGPRTRSRRPRRSSVEDAASPPAPSDDRSVEEASDLPLVVVYADESCLKNGSPRAEGGAAALVVRENDGTVVREDLWFSERGTTNNRMAIQGAIEVMRRLRRSCRIRYVTDSNYLIKGGRAAARRCVSGDLDERANGALWKRLVEAMEPHAVTWVWVRGHNGHPENEYVDDLAREAARFQNESGGFVPSAFEGTEPALSSELDFLLTLSVREQLEALRTPKGGFNRKTLEGLGVGWPPKKGWKKRLERAHPNGLPADRIEAARPR